MTQTSYLNCSVGDERNQAPARGQGTRTQRVSPPGPLTLLAFNKRLVENPLELPVERRYALFLSEKYKHQYAYLVFKASPKSGRIVDARIVKTYTTLRLIDERARREGLALLLHPQPIAIPKNFWGVWKRAKTASDRIDLVRKHGLAKDENIFVLARILIDVDQPYETAQETVLKVFQKLGIDNGFLLGKSKSGNLRGVIWLSPTNILVGYEIINEERHEVYKDFYLRPHVKHDNGHTHLENLKEFLAILYGLLEREGLEVDWSFFDRINHPIWYSTVDSKFFKPVLSRSGTVRFYDLYRKAKEVQEKEGLWEVPKRGKPFNITQHFWPQHYKPPREKKEEKRVEIPAFVRNEFDAFTLWQRAVESLAKKHSRERFMKVIVPAVGWAKYLNLSQYEVEDFLEDLLPDKKRDIQIALRWAKELPFDAKGTPKSYKLSEYLQKAVDYIQNKDGKVKRQELLTEVFHKQVWLLELVMAYLEKKGYVESHTEKSGGRGRPSKVYVLSRPLECDLDHSQTVEPQALCGVSTDHSDPEGGVSGQEFSLYTNSPVGRAIHEVDGLELKEVGSIACTMSAYLVNGSSSLDGSENSNCSDREQERLFPNSQETVQHDTTQGNTEKPADFKTLEKHYLSVLAEEYKKLKGELSLSVDTLFYYYNHVKREWEVIDCSKTLLKLKLDKLSLDECLHKLREAFSAIASPTTDNLLGGSHEENSLP